MHISYTWSAIRNDFVDQLSIKYLDNLMTTFRLDVNLLELMMGSLKKGKKKEENCFWILTGWHSLMNIISKKEKANIIFVNWTFLLLDIPL